MHEKVICKMLVTKVNARGSAAYIKTHKCCAEVHQGCWTIKKIFPRDSKQIASQSAKETGVCSEC